MNFTIASRIVSGGFAAVVALAANGAANAAVVTCTASPSGSPYACATSSSAPVLYSKDDVVSTTAFPTSVGSASGVDQVDVTTNIAVKTGSGVVNIEPASEGGSLTQITFTPHAGNTYGGLFFTEQATGGSWNGELTAVVTYGASSSVTFTWSHLSANETYNLGFADQGPGSTPFTSAVLSLGTGGKFEHVEDIRMSAATGGSVGAVPELSTWALMAAGFAGLGAVGLLRSRKSVAA